MKTKLEVGKEYWLGEAKKFKGIYKGSFGKASYFDVTYGDANFTRDANGYVEFPERGVFEIEKPFHFTTPIAMRCTEEQFNGIKGKLVKMGYRPSFITFMSDNIYLCTAHGLDSKIISDFSKLYIENSNVDRIVFDEFNPDLFLALAAMTDKEDGIKGEWWKCGDKFWTQTSENKASCHTDTWSKATAQEIIEHFEKTEFVLQPIWYVELTESNRDIVIPWHKSVDKRSGRAYNIGSYYGIFESGAGDAWSSRELASQYQIITTDQFKKYVLKETDQSCQKTPVVGSIEYTVNVEFDAEKAAEEIFKKVVAWSNNRHESKELSPAEKYLKLSNSISKGYFVFDYKSNLGSTETVFDKTIISIPPTKQATLFDDRVEITDWEPKEGEIVWVVTNEIGSLIYKDIEYNGSLLHAFLFRNGFIKRTECEAKRLVEKLKQAML